jgi:hypothetical protein
MFSVSAGIARAAHRCGSLVPISPSSERAS